MYNMAKTYGQHCPIARALDVVGERWSLLIVRELLLGPLRYTDLRAALPGIGTRVLADRLKHLADEGVIEMRRLPPPASADAYQLTAWGEKLRPVASALAAWGSSLTGRPRRGDARSPTSAMMALWRRALVRPRPPAGRWQLLLDGQAFELSVDDAGTMARRGESTAPDGTAALAASDAIALLDGRLTFGDAAQSGRVDLRGRMTDQVFSGLFGA
jgi:DNA-binding HxlR family transcriptional regulator